MGNSDYCVLRSSEGMSLSPSSCLSSLSLLSRDVMIIVISNVDGCDSWVVGWGAYALLWSFSWWDAQPWATMLMVDVSDAMDGSCLSQFQAILCIFNYHFVLLLPNYQVILYFLRGCVPKLFCFNFLVLSLILYISVFALLGSYKIGFWGMFVFCVVRREGNLITKILSFGHFVSKHVDCAFLQRFLSDFRNEQVWMLSIKMLFFNYGRGHSMRDTFRRRRCDRVSFETVPSADSHWYEYLTRTRTCIHV